MPRRSLILMVLVLGAVQELTAQVHHPLTGESRYSAGMALGYLSGRGLEAHFTTPDLGTHLPLRARLGVRYAAVDPGNAVAARRIFINDNTDGTPQQAGRTWGFTADLVFPFRLLSLPHAYAFAGVRQMRFTGSYHFVGGNEDFDVRSTNWGLGGGLESQYPVSPRVSLFVTGGVDYYFPSSLYGHDTTYNPDGTNVNGRNNYSYATADRAIGQPKLDPLMMLGLDWRF